HGCGEHFAEGRSGAVWRPRNDVGPATFSDPPRIHRRISVDLGRSGNVAAHFGYPEALYLLSTLCEPHVLPHHTRRALLPARKSFAAKTSWARDHRGGHHDRGARIIENERAATEQPSASGRST